MMPRSTGKPQWVLRSIMISQIQVDTGLSVPYAEVPARVFDDLLAVRTEKTKNNRVAVTAVPCGEMVTFFKDDADAVKFVQLVWSDLECRKAFRESKPADVLRLIPRWFQPWIMAMRAITDGPILTDPTPYKASVT